MGAGAFGVVCTSAFYAIAGPQATMPGGADSMEAARAATTAPVRALMRVGGAIGMPSDVLLGVGSLMLAATRRTTSTR